VSRAASVFAAVIGVVVIVAGALSLMRAEVSPGQPIAATAAPTGSATAGGSATAAASRAVGEVSVRMGKVTAASEFRYVVSGGADTFRVILLDLGAGAATEVATVSVGAGGNPADGPYLFTSASRDGRAVLLTVNVPGARSTVLLLRPEAGDARELYRGSPFDRAVISADGTRYALSRAADDPAVNGVWVGTLGAGAPRRLVADDPSASGAPPVPVAFAPDGQTLAVRVNAGDGVSEVYLIPVAAAEGRVARDLDPVRIVGGDALAVGGANVDFGDGREILVWTGQNPFGGANLVSLFDRETRRRTELYRPPRPTSQATEVTIADAAWHPRRDRFVTVERQFCCGANLPSGVFVRGRDGTAREVARGAFFLEVWWSRDGSRLFATTGGDDSTGSVSDLLTGTVVARYCLRGPGPPPCP